jgi:hypothetical protein
MRKIEQVLATTPLVRIGDQGTMNRGLALGASNSEEAPKLPSILARARHFVGVDAEAWLDD